MIFPVLVLSLFGITAADAYPAPLTEQPASTDLVLEVKKGKGHGAKHHNKHHNKHGHNYKHGGKYWYGNRYWTHRYSYRPLGWRAYGCVAVGPVWYCP
jgi:hypothetical protein